MGGGAAWRNGVDMWRNVVWRCGVVEGGICVCIGVKRWVGIKKKDDYVHGTLSRSAGPSWVQTPPRTSSLVFWRRFYNKVNNERRG